MLTAGEKVIPQSDATNPPPVWSSLKGLGLSPLKLNTGGFSQGYLLIVKEINKHPIILDPSARENTKNKI